jgi:hypothetical protein
MVNSGGQLDETAERCSATLNGQAGRIGRWVAGLSAEQAHRNIRRWQSHQRHPADPPHTALHTHSMTSTLTSPPPPSPAHPPLHLLPCRHARRRRLRARVHERHHDYLAPPPRQRQQLHRLLHVPGGQLKPGGGAAGQGRGQRGVGTGVERRLRSSCRRGPWHRAARCSRQLERAGQPALT